MYTLEQRLTLANQLASAFLDGPWRAELLAERAAEQFDRWPEWLMDLAVRAVALAPGGAPSPDRHAELASLVERFLRHREPSESDQQPPLVIRLVRPQPRGRRPGELRAGATSRRVPIGVLRGWEVRRIESSAALAELLELTPGQLLWLADVRGLERSVAHERLRNYRYRWLPRPGGLPRMLEVPKGRLKEIQRWVLHEILDQVPAHPAAHGFVRGRSALSNATCHTGAPLVLSLDLRDFFASVPAARVYGIFSSLGHPPDVAHLLTGLCTNVVPLSVWREQPVGETPASATSHFRLGRLLATPHLPQGAPTSPALANLAAFGLDRRLSVLAASFGLRYSRYADDLTLSGPGRSRARQRALLELCAEVAAGEGFVLNRAKTRVRTRAQRQLVTGIVVNSRTNAPRARYDRLRAQLHRLAHSGAEQLGARDAAVMRSQLLGEISWIGSLNARRGERLRAQFEAIDWPS